MGHAGGKLADTCKPLRPPDLALLLLQAADDLLHAAEEMVGRVVERFAAPLPADGRDLLAEQVAGALNAQQKLMDRAAHAPGQPVAEEKASDRAESSDHGQAPRHPPERTPVLLLRLFNLMAVENPQLAAGRQGVVLKVVRKNSRVLVRLVELAVIVEFAGNLRCEVVLLLLVGVGVDVCEVGADLGVQGGYVLGL